MLREQYGALPHAPIKTLLKKGLDNPQNSKIIYDYNKKPRLGVNLGGGFLIV